MAGNAQAAKRLNCLAARRSTYARSALVSQARTGPQGRRCETAQALKRTADGCADRPARGRRCRDCQGASRADCRTTTCAGVSRAQREPSCGCIRNALTFDMSGGRQTAKLAVDCPLDGRVRAGHVRGRVPVVGLEVHELACSCDALNCGWKRSSREAAQLPGCTAQHVRAKRACEPS